jgi:hypothetical protein
MPSPIRFKPFVGSRYIRSSQGAAAGALQRQFRQNMDGLLGSLSKFFSDFKEATPDALVEILEPTLGKAITYCPEDTGTLRSSAYLEAETQRGKAVVAIGFGRGGQPSYAIFVHELPYQHDAPTTYKFLERAVDEDYQSIVAQTPKVLRELAGT